MASHGRSGWPCDLLQVMATSCWLGRFASASMLGHKGFLLSRTAGNVIDRFRSSFALLTGW